jgi:hypothetical protein
MLTTPPLSIFLNRHGIDIVSAVFFFKRSVVTNVKRLLTTTSTALPAHGLAISEQPWLTVRGM